MLIIVAVGAGVVACGLAIIRRLITIVTVAGASMAPNLASGDRLLVIRAPFRSARTGRIVVIANPAAETDGPRQPSWLVKRVIAVAGDPVPVDRVPVLAGTADSAVPPGCLVLLGDSVMASVDSRHYGYFDRAELLGVVARIWPRSTAALDSRPIMDAFSRVRR